MFCYICQKKILVKKTIFNLFVTETHHICEYCLDLYPIYIQYQVIPKDIGVINWYSLIHSDEDLDGIAYMSFLKPLYIDYLKHDKKSIYLYFDVISDKLMLILQSIGFGDIYLVTLYDEIKEKEHAYVI